MNNEQNQPEPTEAEIRSAKRRKFGMNVLKGIGYVVGGTVAAASVVASSNARPSRMAPQAPLVSGYELERQEWARRAQAFRYQQLTGQPQHMTYNTYYS